MNTANAAAHDDLLRDSSPPATAAPRAYIDHIDGIRCLAVTLVLLFHAKIPAVGGGFIGVDVFFVISGFLMTRILLGTPMDVAGFRAFFVGRARRILPAYVLTIAVVSALAAIVFLPIHLELLAPSLASAILLVSNFVFWRTTDYFSPDLSYNPLLHTWSLAVEWQFYLFYPFLFLVARRLRMSMRLAIAAIGLLSFGVCAVLIFNSKNIAAFYMLPTRVWEFAIGAMVVFAPRLKVSPLVGTASSALGLAAILFCAVTYDRRTNFPGATALLPCLGTAALIYFGAAQGPINRLLSFGPVRTIGQASYSIYLWHWPLIVFLAYRLPSSAGATDWLLIASIVVLSAGLGLVSWKYVELPFRQRSGAPARMRLSWIVPVAVVPLIVGLAIRLSDGFPQRFSPEVIQVAGAYRDSGQFRDCLSRSATAGNGAQNLCRLGQASAPLSFVVLGDSHAAAIAHGISKLAVDAGRGGVLSAADACAPMFSFPSGYLPTKIRCERAQNAIQSLVSDIHPDRVILHAAWAKYYDHDAELFKTALEETLSWFKARNIRVYLVGDTPGARDNVPISMAKRIAFGLEPSLAFDYSEFVAKNAAVEGVLKDAAEKFDFVYVDLADRLCENARCPVEFGEYPLYWDDSHLSGNGAIYISRFLHLF